MSKRRPMVTFGGMCQETSSSSGDRVTSTPEAIVQLPASLKNGIFMCLVSDAKEGFRRSRLRAPSMPAFKVETTVVSRGLVHPVDEGFHESFDLLDHAICNAAALVYPLGRTQTNGGKSQSTSRCIFLLLSTERRLGLKAFNRR